MQKTYISFALLTLVLTFAGPGCSEDPEHEAKKKGQELWFDEYLHDYGQITRGSDGLWTFACKNLGETPIVINKVRSTCGCTIPDWTKEPIEPGATGEITIKYNTALTGTFLKSLYVYSSAANSPVKIQVKGKVIAGEEENPKN